MSRPAKRPEQAALFGDDLPEAPPAPRVNDRPEAAALAEVLQVLRHHPLVAWIERQNSGVARIRSRFVRFGWPGFSDVLGQLKDGRLLAVECKALKEKLQAEQTQSSYWCASSVAEPSWRVTAHTHTDGSNCFCAARTSAVNSLQQERIPRSTPCFAGFFV